MEETYSIAAVCENCETRVMLHIPKGVTIKTFLARKEDKCTNCGCSEWARLYGEFDEKIDGDY